MATFAYVFGEVSLVSWSASVRLLDITFWKHTRQVEN